MRLPQFLEGAHSRRARVALDNVRPAQAQGSVLRGPRVHPRHRSGSIWPPSGAAEIAVRTARIECFT